MRRKSRSRNERSRGAASSTGKADKADWTFLTNHAHVLLSLARDPGMRIRDVAAEVGITERGVQRIIAELEAAGYLERARRGRRNAYHIHGTRPMRHRIERHRKIEDLIRLVHGGS